MSEQKKKGIIKYTSELKIVSLSETDTKKEEMRKTVYKIVAENAISGDKLVLSSPEVFNGMNPGDVISVIIGNNQLSLKDYE
jgi:hypothetical protein